AGAVGDDDLVRPAQGVVVERACEGLHSGSLGSGSQVVSAHVATSAVLHEVTGDDIALDLAGPLSELQDLRSGVEAGDLAVRDVAVATVDLEALTGAAIRHFARVELRHRGLPGEVLTGIGQTRRAVDEAARSSHLRLHRGELVGDRLELVEGASE